MNRVSMQQLSDLVLVEILAALPMSAAVRLAQLGHQRLQAMSCRPWVLRRMADVNFSTAVRAYQVGRLVRESFCSETVLRRLYGRIDGLPYQWEYRFPVEAFTHVMRNIPGHLSCTQVSRKFVQNLRGLTQDKLSKIRYVTCLDSLYADDELIHFPSLIIGSTTDSRSIGPLFYDFWNLHYRPALLNGRHVVDVWRTVCGPLDFSEAPLDRVRRTATENASDVTHHYAEEHGRVWRTRFCM